MRLEVHTAVMCHSLAAAELREEVAALICPQLLLAVSGISAPSSFQLLCRLPRQVQAL